MLSEKLRLDYFEHLEKQNKNSTKSNISGWEKMDDQLIVSMYISIVSENESLEALEVE